jgi:hypothetical protein
LLTFKTIMTQFPINLAEAVTGHKLQGRTLDKMIITGWDYHLWKTGNTQFYLELKLERACFCWNHLIQTNVTVPRSNSEDSSNVSRE